MAGLLSGLASLGLGNLEKADVFEEPAAQEEPVQKQAPAAPAIQEKDLIFDRSFECPVCNNKITSKIMKSGKAKLERTDMDLRPKYEGIDPLKYDVILCPQCGYAALSRFFKAITSAQGKMIKEGISKNIHLQPFSGDYYTYEEAKERYKLALACAIVKQAKPSEKAYVCLKMAWVIRGEAESLDETEAGYAEKKAGLEQEEQEFLKTALEGFINARQTEEFPMCGMDETTVEYLIAVLATRFGQYDIASKLVGSILISSSANARMKDKTRDLKDIILQEMKQNK